MPQEHTSQQLISFFFRPEKIIRNSAAAVSLVPVVLIAAVASIPLTTFEFAWNIFSAPSTYPAILFYCLASGTVSGIFNLFMVGFFIKLSGSVAGGRSSYRKILAAYSFSRTPFLLLLVLLCIEISIYGDIFFNSKSFIISTPELPAALSVIFRVIEIILVICFVRNVFFILKELLSLGAVKTIFTILLTFLLYISFFAIFYFAAH